MAIIDPELFKQQHFQNLDELLLYASGHVIPLNDALEKEGSEGLLREASYWGLLPIDESLRSTRGHPYISEKGKLFYEAIQKYLPASKHREIVGSPYQQNSIAVYMPVRTLAAPEKSYDILKKFFPEITGKL